MPKRAEGHGEPSSKNIAIAHLFDLMADVLEIRGANVFRVRAYRRAAQSLRSLSADVAAVAREHGLEGIPGIGADLAHKIGEYLETGRIADIEAARRQIPAGVVALMQVPGIGPRTAQLLYEREHVTGIEQLEAIARAGKLRGIKGIQAKTEENILKGIAVMRGGQSRMPLGIALPLGDELVAALERQTAVQGVALAGSIRRRKETVGDIDLLVTSARPDAVMRAFTQLPQVAEVLERGPTKAAIRHREGIQVDLRVVEAAAFGAALLYFTGSKQHNIRLREMAVKRGLKISEYGVFRERTGRRIAGATEEEIYAAVGLPWIAPELREDAGEIEAAVAGRLPVLVDLADIRGDLHCHTNASDGQESIEAMVAAAERRGYEYLAITDHSRSTRIAGGLTPAELRAHVRRIRAVAARHPRIQVLAGSECDILPDGTLDYDDRLLSELDVVVAAVHGHLKQSRGAMTTRVCAALANPNLTVLAHPTGRVIGERDAFDLDLDAVLRTAKRFDKAVEINAHPNRLDLRDVDARRAHQLHVHMAVGTDAHVADGLDAMALGVATARRGWVGKGEIVNTWPAGRLVKWIAGQRDAMRRRTSR